MSDNNTILLQMDTLQDDNDRLRAENEALREALEGALRIIEEHVPREALGINSYGGGDGFNDHSWPVLDEFTHYARAALQAGGKS